MKYCANWMSFHIAASGRASSVASDETIAQTLQEEYDTEAAWEEENASIISTNPLQVRCGVCRSLGSYTGRRGLGSELW